MAAAYAEALGLGLTDRTDKVMELVARRIMLPARQGERDRVKLRDSALELLEHDGDGST
jgi:hypothetical protein